MQLILTCVLTDRGFSPLNDFIARRVKPFFEILNSGINRVVSYFM